MFKMPWQRPDAAPVPSAAPIAREVAHVRETPETPATRTIHATRQPILGKDSAVTGYEILYRGGSGNRFDRDDLERTTAATIERSAFAIGLNTLVGDRTAFVNLTRDALVGGCHHLLPASRLVLELPSTVEPDGEYVNAIRKARAEGYRVALDNYTFAPANEPLLDLVSMVKVNFRTARKACEPFALDALRVRKLELLAENVETRAEYHAAVGCGYDMFQGYYFCRPQLIRATDLPPAKMNVLRFLAEVSREDASFEQLEELFKQDVSLTMRLLRYLNSAAFGWRHEIETLNHALALMGLRPLRKWAMMMGVLSLCDDQPSELTVTALARGRFAERIGPHAGLVKQEIELFLTGMLSLVDTMVGRPRQEVLEGLALPEAVRAALLDGRNPLSSVLDMVTAYERGDWNGVAAACPGTSFDEEMLYTAYVDSLAWAEATAKG